MSTEAKCPFHHAAGEGTSNRDWWPNQLRLQILSQRSPLSNPMDKGFNYAKAFNSLDLAAVKKDILALMTTLDRFSFAWRGTVREPIESPTAEEARGPASSDSLLSIAGPTT
jgi:catalase (peroxidase I)